MLLARFINAWVVNEASLSCISPAKWIPDPTETARTDTSPTPRASFVATVLPATSAITPVNAFPADAAPPASAELLIADDVAATELAALEAALTAMLCNTWRLLVAKIKQ